MVRESLKDPAVPLSGEDLVTVLGRLEPCVVVSDGRPLRLSEGLRGTIELQLAQRSLASLVLSTRSATGGSHP
jgi:hypothetical protein